MLTFFYNVFKFYPKKIEDLKSNIHVCWALETSETVNGEGWGWVVTARPGLVALAAPESILVESSYSSSSSSSSGSTVVPFAATPIEVGTVTTDTISAGPVTLGWVESGPVVKVTPSVESVWFMTAAIVVTAAVWLTPSVVVSSFWTVTLKLLSLFSFEKLEFLNKNFLNIKIID